MSDVSGVTSSKSTTDIVSQTSNDYMDKDAFLNLLVTELQYQDPLDPVDNKSFIAELANFSALEQMTNLNDSFELLGDLQLSLLNNSITTQAASLIGKEVTVQVEVDDEIKGYTGVVSGIFFEEGVPSIIIDDMAFNLEDVVQISNPTESKTTE